MWQAQVEIEDYSGMYFDLIAVFEALYCWTSVAGLICVCYISNESTKRVWALPLAEVQQYSALNAAIISKYVTE